MQVLLPQLLKTVKNMIQSSINEADKIFKRCKLAKNNGKEFILVKGKISSGAINILRSKGCKIMTITRSYTARIKGKCIIKYIQSRVSFSSAILCN